MQHYSAHPWWQPCGAHSPQRVSANKIHRQENRSRCLTLVEPVHKLLDCPPGLPAAARQRALSASPQHALSPTSASHAHYAVLHALRSRPLTSASALTPASARKLESEVGLSFVSCPLPYLRPTAHQRILSERGGLGRQWAGSHCQERRCRRRQLQADLLITDAS
eukprot:6159415-Pleurochrysis_carterae.AAC.2